MNGFFKQLNPKFFPWQSGDGQMTDAGVSDEMASLTQFTVSGDWADARAAADQICMSATRHMSNIHDAAGTQPEDFVQFSLLVETVFDADVIARALRAETQRFQLPYTFSHIHQIDDAHVFVLVTSR